MYMMRGVKRGNVLNYVKIVNLMESMKLANIVEIIEIVKIVKFGENWRHSHWWEKIMQSVKL